VERCRSTGGALRRLARTETDPQQKIPVTMNWKRFAALAERKAKKADASG